MCLSKVWNKKYKKYKYKYSVRLNLEFTSVRLCVLVKRVRDENTKKIQIHIRVRLCVLVKSVVNKNTKKYKFKYSLRLNLEFTSVRLCVLVESVGNKNVKTHRKICALPPPCLRGAPVKESGIKPIKK